MRISDWSSDVCSSELPARGRRARRERGADLVPELGQGKHEKYGIGRIEKERHIGEQALDGGITPCRDERDEQHERERASEFGQSEHGLPNGARGGEIGRAACRERVCTYV